MKYDADIDPDNLNTSHGLVVDLVGTGRNVLDVGCSTGQLGRILTERGNKVTGFEVDAAAAAIAEGHLQRVVVGDLETDDLAERLAGERFDVIVFADVLEHLRDPVSVLERSAELLSGGGSVVISIPNVAHGAVRLALLGGHFDYGELGLLDRTHLRFFTRSTLDDLLRDAGFSAVEVCRTTADVFATEIALDPTAFSEEVLERVSGAAEAATYQFVVRAVPSVTLDPVDATSDLLSRWPGPTPEQELTSLRADVAEIVRSLGPMAALPAVGLVSWSLGGESRVEALRRLTVACELRRRLGHVALRCYTLGDPETINTDDAEPLSPMLPWGGGKAAQLADEVLSLIVLPPLASSLSSGDDLLDQVVDDLRDRGCEVMVFDGSFPAPAESGYARSSNGNIEPVEPPIDPLVLADRLHPPEVLHTRLDYLRFVGAVDERRPLVFASLASSVSTHTAALSRALADLVSSNDAQIVFDVTGVRDDGGTDDIAAELMSLVPQSTCLGSDAPGIDLLAIVAGADLVVSEDAGVVAMAAALRTPYIGLALMPSPQMNAFAAASQDPDLMVSRADQLTTARRTAVVRAADFSQLIRLTDRCERSFDETAQQCIGRLSATLASTATSRLQDLGRRIHELEVVNSGLQRKLVHERTAFGVRAASLLSRQEEPVTARRVQPSKQDTNGEATRQEIQDLREELDAVYRLKTMRVLKPARQVYGRWRRRLL